MKLILLILWVALGLYFAYLGYGPKSARTEEPEPNRWARLALLIAAFALLFSNTLAVGPLGYRFVPENSATEIAGLLLTILGVGLALWSRHTLGQYWSDKVGLKIGHELISAGPYAYVRHPIYSGILLGLAGSVLAVGQLGGIVAFLAVLVSFFRKAAKEENLLDSEFGVAFRRYKERTGFLIPRFR